MLATLYNVTSSTTSNTTGDSRIAHHFCISPGSKLEVCVLGPRASLSEVLGCSGFVDLSRSVFNERLSRSALRSAPTYSRDRKASPYLICVYTCPTSQRSGCIMKSFLQHVSRSRLMGVAFTAAGLWDQEVGVQIPITFSLTPSCMVTSYGGGIQKLS